MQGRGVGDNAACRGERVGCNAECKGKGGGQCGMHAREGVGDPNLTEHVLLRCMIPTAIDSAV